MRCKRNKIAPWARDSKTNRLHRPKYTFFFDDLPPDAFRTCLYHKFYPLLECCGFTSCDCTKNFKARSWAKFFGKIIEIKKKSIFFFPLYSSAGQVWVQVKQEDAIDLMENKDSAEEFVTRSLFDPCFQKALLPEISDHEIDMNMGALYYHFTNLLQLISLVRSNLTCKMLSLTSHLCPSILTKMSVYAWMKHNMISRWTWERWIKTLGIQFMLKGDFDPLHYIPTVNQVPFRSDLCKGIQPICDMDLEDAYVESKEVVTKMAEKGHLTFEPKSLLSLAAYRSNLVIYLHLNKHGIQSDKYYYTKGSTYQDNPFFNRELPLVTMW